MNSHKFEDFKKNFKPSNWTKYVLMFSGTIILVGLILFIVVGFNLGMDFTGGNIVKVETYAELNDADYSDVVNKSSDILAEQGLSLSQAQRVGSGNEFYVSIQYQNKGGDADMEAINATIVSSLQDAYPEYNVISAESKSSTASAELLLNALLAIVIALVFIMIYIAFRFEFLSGVAALITLFHDVLIMCACVLIFQIQINSAFVAAVITVLGYSINNTIIIFDRVRENLKKPSLEKLSNNDIANLSVRQTLTRTISTSLTTVVAVALLACIGVAQMSEFVIPILIGLLAGTYASIFISAPMWTMLMSKSKRNLRNKIKTEKSKVQASEVEQTLN